MFKIAQVGLLSHLVIAVVSGQQLSRPQAGEMIRKSESFRVPITTKFSSGCVRSHPGSPEDRWFFEPRSVEHILESLGYIVIRESQDQEHCNDNLQGRAFIISFTNSGIAERRGSGWKGKEGVVSQWSVPTPFTWEIPIATRELIEVTGILKTGEGLARVEYTWKCILNDIGRKMNLPLLSRTSQGYAVFRLYDDGWRLIDAQPVWK